MHIMDYNGTEFQIMKYIETNPTTTLMNLKSIYGTIVELMINNGYLLVTNGMISFSNKGHNVMTPVDLTENTRYKNNDMILS